MFQNTEHMRTEEALRQSEERFRSLTESTSDIIWEVDARAVYTYVNPKITEVLGYEPDEVIGQLPFFDFLVVPEDRARIRDEFKAFPDRIPRLARPAHEIGLAEANARRLDPLADQYGVVHAVPFIHAAEHVVGAGIDRQADLAAAGFAHPAKEFRRHRRSVGMNIRRPGQIHLALA